MKLAERCSEDRQSSGSKAGLKATSQKVAMGIGEIARIFGLESARRDVAETDGALLE